MRKILALATLALSSTFMHAQAAHVATGSLFSADTLNYSYGDGCTWSVGSSYALLNLAPTGRATDQCDVLETDYSFSTPIPANATITGIQFVFGSETLKAGQTAGGEVLLASFGQSVGTLKTFVATSTGTYFTLGSSSDVWGTNLTPAQANNLVVRLTASGPNEVKAATTLAVGGSATLSVYYTTPQ